MKPLAKVATQLVIVVAVPTAFVLGVELAFAVKSKFDNKDKKTKEKPATSPKNTEELLKNAYYKGYKQAMTDVQFIDIITAEF